MKRFEVPFTNPSHADRLNGLCLDAIDIAESAALQRSINDFMLVAVDDPVFESEGHTFNYRRTQLMGSRGILLSVYMQQAPFKTRSIEQSHVIRTASLDNPEVTTWATTLVPKRYQERETELVIGEFEEESSMPLMDLGMSPEELEEEALRNHLFQEREWRDLPRVRFGGDAWQYEENRTIEPLTDLNWVVDRVKLAITRKFGKAAFPRFDPEYRKVVEATGQKEEKMVA